MEATGNEQYTPMPRIGDKAPAFKAVTTQGEIDFPKDYEGSWVILFSHPADFTPVCTSEFMTFATSGGQVRQGRLQAGGPVGGRPLQPHRLAAHHQGQDRVQGHEERRGDVPPDRGHHHGRGPQVRHDPAGRGHHQSGAGRLLHRPQGRYPHHPLLPAEPGPQLRRDLPCCSSASRRPTSSAWPPPPTGSRATT